MKKIMFTTQNGWTKEKMIDHVKTNFKGKSMNTAGACMYRGPDGRKCGVGMFIPDDKYKPTMDSNTSNGGGGVNAEAIIENYDLHTVMPLDKSGMFALQRAHDQSEVDNCLENMIDFIREGVEDGKPQ